MSLLTDRPTISSAVAAANELSPAGAAHRPVGARETSGSSLVFLGQPDARQPAYCLKVRKPVRSIPPTMRKADQLPTALEYRMMVSVAEHFSWFPEFSHSLLRPVRHMAAHDAIVTEYADGTPLNELLPRLGNALTSRWNMGNLRGIAEMCGAWVRALHTMSRPEWLPVRTWDSERAEQRARRAAADMPERLRAQLPMSDLMDRIRDFPPHSQRLVVSHGDFHPGNILVSGSRIVVVDLGTAGVRPVEDDLAFFMVHMFTQKHRVVYGDIAGSLALVRDLCDAFLAGYKSRDEADPRLHLRPMLAVLIVERLAQMSTTIERLPRVVQPLLTGRLLAWAKSELPLLLEWR